ncbi:MAG: hypothetical protein IJ523_07220 [Succinivibrionaceae bacterium]|nr:hypothetical protein [Succinivibrionaceae bacterium]
MRPESNRDRILNEYFEWMIRLVCDGKYSRRLSWRKLFRLLHETEFIYILEMDGNRADDGMDLRYRFAYESGYDERMIDDAMVEKPCSLLEMMVALAQRCEEHITDDPDSGNRTGKWFFEMIESLGLIIMDDEHFDKVASADILVRFMRREYLPDGRGGLFTISNSGHDMRSAEIWYQMMWYLNENIYGRRSY